MKNIYEMLLIENLELRSIYYKDFNSHIFLINKFNPSTAWQLKQKELWSFCRSQIIT